MLASKAVRYAKALQLFCHQHTDCCGDENDVCPFYHSTRGCMFEKGDIPEDWETDRLSLKVGSVVFVHPNNNADVHDGDKGVIVKQDKQDESFCLVEFEDEERLWYDVAELENTETTVEGATYDDYGEEEEE